MLKNKWKNEVKSYSKYILHNFFLPKVDKCKTSNDNNNSNDADLDVDETLEAAPLADDENNAVEGSDCDESISATSSISNARQRSIYFDYCSFLCYDY